MGTDKQPPQPPRPAGSGCELPAGKRNRDDFPAKVITRLAERVAYRCSICRVPTIGPGHGAPDAIAKIGKGAHIAAAAPGGPRYDSLMTPAQRRAITNGIWLCAGCATNIDVDVVAYPTARLRDLKAKAEEKANAEKGRRQPDADDVQAEVLAMLTGGTPKVTLGAIPHTHTAVQQALHKLDPRLRVETSYINGTAQYGIHPLQDVDFEIHVPRQLADQWRNGLNEVTDHGREVRLPAAGLRMTGSPVFGVLFDTMSLAEAHLTVGPALKRDAVEKLRLLDPATGAIEQLDDVHGSISSGRKSVTFEGRAFGGAVSMTLRMERTEGTAPWRSTFNLSLHFDGWEGIDFQALPYLDKLLSLFARLRAGWQLELELEIDGKSIGSCRGGATTDLQGLDSMAEVIEYVAAIREIAAYVGSRIQFRCSTKYSNQDVARVCEVRDRLRGRRVFGPEVCPVTTTLIVRGDNVRSILAPAIPALRVEFDERELKAFGQSLVLPRRRVEILNFEARIAGNSVDVGALKDGDQVPVELLPGRGFKYVESYVPPGERERPFHADRQIGGDT